MRGEYGHFQKWYTSRNTTLTAASTQDDATLISVRSANHQLWLQRIYVSVTTYSAKTWTFTDSTGTPVPNGLISIAAAAEAHVSESGVICLDFGAEGYGLPVGKDLKLDVSATGVAAIVKIECYERLRQDAGVALASTN